MYSDDRVLVVYVPRPADFDVICQAGWYRLPVRRAPRGWQADYFAFYFGRSFGPRKWAIHTFARRRGHELVRRRTLLPQESDHPRADELYYQVQLGPVQTLVQPIIARRRRRITFLQTTGDRFLDAVEINDLVIEGEGYAHRSWLSLRDQASLVYEARLGGRG